MNCSFVSRTHQESQVVLQFLVMCGGQKYLKIKNLFIYLADWAWAGSQSLRVVVGCMSNFKDLSYLTLPPPTSMKACCPVLQHHTTRHSHSFIFLLIKITTKFSMPANSKGVYKWLYRRTSSDAVVIFSMSNEYVKTYAWRTKRKDHKNLYILCHDRTNSWW